MKANNLTICIDATCDKNCPYCISKMTFAPWNNDILFTRNLEKAVEMAKLASVSSVLLTSKGETLNNLDKVKQCCSMFKAFPLEIQTNGRSLSNYTLGKLYEYGINTIAISIDTFKSIDVLASIYKIASILGINIRLTIVLTDMWDVDPNRFFREIKSHGIKQLTFRKATVPSNYLDKTTANWIYTNTKKDHTPFLDYFRRDFDPKHLVRELSFGSSVYDICGVSISIIDYCIQENNNTEDIRSLIYHQDGHMYTSWDKKGSILF